MRWRGADDALRRRSRGRGCTRRGPAAEKSPGQQTVLKSMSKLVYEFLRTWGYIQFQTLEKSIKNNPAWFFTPYHSLSPQQALGESLWLHPVLTWRQKYLLCWVTPSYGQRNRVLLIGFTIKPFHRQAVYDNAFVTLPGQPRIQLPT